MNRDAVKASLGRGIERYEREVGKLPGIIDDDSRVAFVEQLADSVRRSSYFKFLLEQEPSASRINPAHEAFDPLRAAIYHERAGNRDEAFWLIFLFVHFGKSRQSGWHLIAEIYGRLNDGALWSWDAVSADVNGFRDWLDDYVRATDERGSRRAFGNHRKYESLDAWSPNGSGSVIASYVDWVGPSSHDARIEEITASRATPSERFDALYESVQEVRRFGRTAAFDYCASLAKLEFVAIEPSRACLVGATGPLKGARLLLTPGRDSSPTELEGMLRPLRSALDVGFDVLEDALCNWQKSPARFMPFRG